MKLIEYLKQIYQITPLCNKPKNDLPYLFLRHDVDVSLSAALKMAKIEHEIGVKSTYFVLVSSRHYNSFDGKNSKIIKQISELGHELGLHYDVSQYGHRNEDIVNSLTIEVQALESILGKKICSISSHAPRGPKSFLKVKGYLSADDPNLRDVYVHDSQKLWTIKSLSLLLDSHPKRVQLLIHPCHWMSSIKSKTRSDLVLLTILLLLYKVRTLFIRVVHSRESCDN